jgi:transposase
MRVLPKLGQEIVGQIEEAWKLPQEDWARKRLLVVRWIAQHEHTVAEIMKIAAVCRQTVFTYRDKVLSEGVKGLLKRDWNGARKPAVRGAVAEEFLERLGEGKFRQARDAQTWIKKRTRKTLTESGVRKTIRRLGGKLKVPRKSHVKKDTKAAAEFRVDLSSHLAEAAGTYPDKPVRIWVLDEHRYGLLPVIRRVWGRKGVRVHAPYKTTYQWGYLHEALEVDGQHKVELLFTPMINQDVHAVFLKQISESDPNALHVIVMDQAGFHMKQEDGRVPANIRVLPLPPYCPELNPAEWFGRVVKAPTVNRIYQSLKHLEDHIIAVARRWSDPAKVATLIHEWMRVEVNAIAKPKSLLAR